MRQTVGFILVLVVIGVVAYFGWNMVTEHGKKYNELECGGSESVKCPAGYECINEVGKTIMLGNTGKCRWLLK